MQLINDAWDQLYLGHGSSQSLVYEWSCVVWLSTGCNVHYHIVAQSAYTAPSTGLKLNAPSLKLIGIGSQKEHDSITTYYMFSSV